MIPTRAAALALSAALASTALAQPRPKTGDPRVDDAYPLKLQVGERIRVCETGTILCPAEAPICDDGEVVTWAFGDHGLEFVGVAPGETLCSAGSRNLLRRVYRVTVVADGAAP
jgi:hypothetical protein